MIGLTIAAVGISCALAFQQPLYDGAASIGIGLVLAASSVLLARATTGLLIGEPALLPVRESILRIAAEDRDIDRADGVLTVQMGPEQVLAALSAEFHDGLTTQQIELCVSRVEAAIKDAHLGVTMLFVKPQTPETWRRRTSELGALQARDGKRYALSESMPPSTSLVPGDIATLQTQHRDSRIANDPIAAAIGPQVATRRLAADHQQITLGLLRRMIQSLGNVAVVNDHIRGSLQVLL